jgi:uncharacterized protein YbjT (DUF2867 family)
VEIAVVGGTGTLGSRVVQELAARGHGVRVLSRRAPQQPVADSEHRPIDLSTGDGLREALAGVDTLVDAAGSGGIGKQAWAVHVDGTARLLAAARAEHVSHVVGISIVGIDKVPFSYYRAKLEQERVIEQGGVPWSIVRATQFHQLLDIVFGAAARLRILPLAPFPIRPAAPEIVARVIADIAQQGPAGRSAPVAGPEVATFAELARVWKDVRERHVVALRVPFKWSARRALMAGAILPGSEAVTGGPDFAAWLRAQPAPTGKRMRVPAGVPG